MSAADSRTSKEIFSSWVLLVLYHSRGGKNKCHLNNRELPRLKTGSWSYVCHSQVLWHFAWKQVADDCWKGHRFSLDSLASKIWTRCITECKIFKRTKSCIFILTYFVAKNNLVFYVSKWHVYISIICFSGLQKLDFSRALHDRKLA